MDIIHAPAEDFVRPGDLVLTTGADIHQPGAREFLVSLVASPAAGVVLSPPPDVDAHDLLELMIPSPIGMRAHLCCCPGRLPSPTSRRRCLPLVGPSPRDTRVQMVIGRRVRDEPHWSEAADRFANALHELALAAGLTVTSSVTDDLVMSHFLRPQRNRRYPGWSIRHSGSAGFPKMS